MIVFGCPHCHKKIEVSPEHTGKTGKCQHCGGPVTVPPPEPALPTSLDALRQTPDTAPPERFGAYGKNADAQWQDPAAKPEAAPEPPKPKPEELVLPVDTIPAEVLALAKARKRQTIQYIVAAVIGALILVFLFYPLLLPKPVNENPEPVPPAPKFGEPEGAAEGS